MKEMGVNEIYECMKFMNINEKDKSNEIHVESERRKL